MLGMVILARLVQLLKADSPMLVNVLPERSRETYLALLVVSTFWIEGLLKRALTFSLTA